MQSVMPDTDYQKINSFINAKLGLNFPHERKGDLVKALKNAALDFHMDNVPDLINYLTTSSVSDDEFHILSKHLTIGETYFFREKVIFEILKTSILKNIIADRTKICQKIKIWSAGCSSGEEAYSIAIQISEVIPFIKNWDITILGTDINPNMIKKARKGNYSEWSFRDVNNSIKDKYFTKDANNKYSILPQIKKMVEFNQLNLVDDSLHSLNNKTNAFDIIFCRNVLMYFEQQKREKVISAFYNSLVTGGWLILGLTEIGYMTDRRFKTVILKDAIIFQKVIPKYEIPKTKKSSHSNNTTQPVPMSTKKNTSQQNKQDDHHTEKQKNFLNYYSKAKELFEKGSYNEAAILFQKQIDENTEADKKNTYPDNIYYYLSLSLANVGRLSSALEWCEKGIGFFKLDPTLYFLKSNLLQGLNKFEEAIDTLKKTIYLDSDYIMAYFSLGNIYKKLGRKEEANREYKKLLAVLSQQDNNFAIKDSDGMTIDRIKTLVNTFLHN